MRRFMFDSVSKSLDMFRNFNLLQPVFQLFLRWLVVFMQQRLLSFHQQENLINFVDKFFLSPLEFLLFLLNKNIDSFVDLALLSSLPEVLQVFRIVPVVVLLFGAKAIHARNHFLFIVL